VRQAELCTEASWVVLADGGSETSSARVLDLGKFLTKLHQIAELNRLAGARRSTVTQRTHAPEEPDAGNLHVRICGESGRVTARVYPTPISLGIGSPSGSTL